jgi:hypothetical protein
MARESAGVAGEIGHRDGAKGVKPGNARRSRSAEELPRMPGELRFFPCPHRMESNPGNKRRPQLLGGCTIQLDRCRLTSKL